MDLTLIIIIAIASLVILIIAGLAVVNFSTDEMVDKFKQVAKYPAPITPLDFAKSMNSKYFAGKINIQLKNNILSDCYSSTGLLFLSREYANKKHLAGLAICAHELGHAFQFKNQRAKMAKYGKRIRTSKIVSKLVSPLFICALVLVFFDKLLLAGALALMAIVCFFVGLCAKMSTVKMETEASEIAIKILQENTNLTDVELKRMRTLLSSAKQTYVADFLRSILKWTGFTRK